MDIPTAGSEERRVRSVVDMMLDTDSDPTMSFRLGDVNHEPVHQPSSKEISQNASVEMTTPKSWFEVPYECYSSNQEKMVPPKRRRKMNQVGNVGESDTRLNEPGTTVAVVYLNDKLHLDKTNTNTERIGDSDSCAQINAPRMSPVSPSTPSFPSVAAGITTLPSSFSMEKPVTTGLMHSHLASLLDQCREALERATQHQRQQEEHMRELQFNNREEVGRLRRKLEQTTSTFRQERESHGRSRDALSQMTKKFELERDTRTHVTSHFTNYLAEVAQTMKQLRSDLTEERRNLQEEKLNSQKILTERADFAVSLEKAREELKVAAANIDTLGRSEAVADGLRETIEKQNKQIKLLNAKRTQTHKDLVSEQQRSTRLEEHSAESKRRLVTFHFGANILTTYFLAMLHENKTRRISSKRKAIDDIHDLWDVQAALKRLVDGCTAFIENIPDRHDFYGDAECPMCLPEIPPPASATASKQAFLRIKKEPTDYCLSRPPSRVPV